MKIRRMSARSGQLAGSLALAAAFGGTLALGGSQEDAPDIRELGQLPAMKAIEPIEAPKWTFAVEPKALSEKVTKGLAWLVSRQLEDGGWGQGEESQNMGNSQAPLASKANVADTCMAALALVRSGAAPGEGPRGIAITRGVAYVCGQIENSDQESLYITDVRGTRVQAKIGTFVDTFLASMLLSELTGRMAHEPENQRVAAALAKVLAKIQHNQQDDGGFAGNGWAPVLSQSMAGKGINRAYQAGADFDIEVNNQNADYFLALAENKAAEDTDSSGSIGYLSSPVRGGGSAGVPLYELAASLGGLQDFVNSSRRREGELNRVLSEASDAAVLKEAQEEKKAIQRIRQGREDAQNEVVGRLQDPSFVAGFGSNGGEEFLSYMNISESLVVEGGEAWKKWDSSITTNLNRVQNDDGCWTGHHCITGRTFVTSAALLTLMADRTPVPVEAAAEPTSRREALEDAE